MILAGKIANPVTMSHFLQDVEPISEEMSFPQYIGRLVVGATTVINAADYAKQLAELAARRALIAIGEDIVNEAYAPKPDKSVAALIEETEGALYALSEPQRLGKGHVSFHDAAIETQKMVSAAYQRGGKLVGISTGLRDLDKMLGGLQASDLIILAGRPSMGKSALAANIAFYAASEAKVPVDFYSLEMSAEQLSTRIVADESDIPSDRLRRGDVTEDEFRKLAAAIQRVGGAPLYIDSTGGLTIGQLSARARRQKRQRKTGLVVVDYLQLMRANKQTGNAVQDITEITTGLKALAKELDVPVLALSQLSRNLESREDKRPQLSDLRSSGSIEQDADVVMFVFREEYYVERTKPAEHEIEKFLEWQKRMGNVSGKGEIIIGKQRHGKVGIVTAAYDGARTRFSDLAQDEGAPR